jgi:hypothetical protein
MPKKIWISLPLVTTADLKDDAVVAFLKGGQKKDLEVEVAAFITKALMDKDVPFGIDFDSCGVDRALVIESLPKRLQKILGASAAGVAEPGEVAASEAAVEVPEVADVEQATDVEEATQVEESGVVEEVAEAQGVEPEKLGDDVL